MSEKPTKETCPNCNRLQGYANTAWNRGHKMGMMANERIATEAMSALRAEQAAHSDTNATLTASLLEAERQRDALADALRTFVAMDAKAKSADISDEEIDSALDTACALLAELEAKP